MSGHSSTLAPSPNNSLDLRQIKATHYYVVPGECRNCGWTGSLMIETGQEAPAFTSDPQTCKVCCVDAVAKTEGSDA